MNKCFSRWWLRLMLLLLQCCAHRFIPGTMVRDTHDNRAILQVLGQFQQALIQRDANALLKLVSTSYFEDNGTPNPHDDYGYDELSQRIVKDCLNIAQEVHINFEIHEVQVTGDTGYADIRYSSRAQLNLPSGKLWDSYRDFDRIGLQREQGNWRIASGL